MEVIETKDGTVYQDSMEIEIITKQTSKAIRDFLDAKDKQIEAQQQEIEQLKADWKESFTKRLEAEAELDRLKNERFSKACTMCEEYETENEQLKALAAKMKKVIGLLNSMVYCKESHTERSEQVVNEAIKAFDDLLGGAGS